jgi:hypothetical protein
MCIEFVYFSTYQGEGESNQTFRGMILRSQLIALLKNKIFNESAEIWNFKQISLKIFRDEYPRYPTIQVRALFCICAGFFKKSFTT